MWGRIRAMAWLMLVPKHRQIGYLKDCFWHATLEGTSGSQSLQVSLIQMSACAEMTERLGDDELRTFMDTRMADVYRYTGQIPLH